MKFQKDQFHYHGGYLTYGSDRKFVARFKYRGPVGKADFVRLLCKYYTVESYLDRVNGYRAPMQILMDDGYITFDTVNKKIMVAK
jgi:hypothetical protein